MVGSSVASLDEIAEVLPYAKGKHYFIVKNFINDTSFFEWNPTIYKNYFRGAADAVEVTIPKLNEMAYEQVELAGVPFSDFVANRQSNGQAGDNSLVLRGYVRTWLKQICNEYDRVGLLDRLYDRTGRRRLIARLRRAGARAVAAARPSLAAIVASLHGRTGKTLLARVLADYFVLAGNRPLLFDTDVTEQTLHGWFPYDTVVADLAEVRDQMILFDTLAARSPEARVVDVSHHVFRKFFKVMQDLPFRRRGARPPGRAGHLLHRGPQSRRLRGRAPAARALRRMRAGAGRECLRRAGEGPDAPQRRLPGVRDA